MGTQQETIRSFMHSLDETTLTGYAALDEAVRASSKFDGMQDLIDHFLADAGDGSSWQSFLEDRCGIILDNEDTGSITGSDTGGGEVKTAESIVPETGAPIESYPDGSFTVKGLTLKVPDADTLTSAERIVVRGLRSWWIEEALNLVEASYGMSFEEEGATAREMTLRFYSKASSGTLASVSSNADDTKLILNINMAYYNAISRADKNGRGSEGAGYLDRTLAHELTHAVMVVNIKDAMSSYPLYLLEGMAELTHGIDDEREADIRTLARDPEQLTKWIRTDKNVGGDGAYSGGYMLLHYLAKQGNSTETGGTSGGSGTAGGSGSSGTSGTTGGSSGTGGTSGGSSGGTGASIWTMQDGDSIVVSSGRDIIRYLDVSGTVDVDGLTSADEVRWEASTYTGFSLSGDGISVRASTGTLSLHDCKNEILTFANARDDVLAYVFLSDGVSNLDGRSLSKYEIIVGGSEDDTIRAGSGGSQLWGGSGSSDTLVGGSGEDCFYYGKHDGNDTFYEVGAEDRVLLYDMTLDDIASLALSSEGAFTVGTKQSGTLTLEGQSSSRTSATFSLADGTSWQWDGGRQQWNRK